MDADGKVVSATVDEPRAGRPEHLVAAFDRVAKILHIEPLALDGDVVRSGVLHVCISATVSDVPVPDRPGGSFGFERAYAHHRGHAAFTLETGRHVEFTIEVLATDATGR